MTFPGWPCNDFDFHFAEAGAALAGLIIRDKNGVPRPGILPSAETLLTAGAGWTINAAPFVASRTVDRAVLLGGTAEQLAIDVTPAPAANARLDVLYTLPAEVGSGDPVEAVAVATGVAGAVPVKPTIPAGAIELGTFRTQAGQASATQGTLANTFPFTTTTGGTLVVRTVAELDAINLIDGARAYVLATDREYSRVKGAWRRDPIVWATTGSVKTIADPEGSVVVPFPTGLFPSAPVCTVTPYSVVPGTRTVTSGATSISTSGATVWIGRTNNVETPFGLTAILP